MLAPCFAGSCGGAPIALIRQYIEQLRIPLTSVKDAAYRATRQSSPALNEALKLDDHRAFRSVLVFFGVFLFHGVSVFF